MEPRWSRDGSGVLRKVYKNPGKRKKWSQDGSKMDRGYCEKFTKTQENEEKWGQDGENRALRRGFVMIL